MPFVPPRIPPAAFRFRRGRNSHADADAHPRTPQRATPARSSCGTWPACCQAPRRPPASRPDLLLAAALTFRGRDVAERLQRRIRRRERPQVFQRDVHAADIAQELIDVARANGAGPVAVSILEQPGARHRPQRPDRVRKARGLEFLFQRLAALGAKRQRDRLAFHAHVRFEQCCRAPRAADSCIAFTAGADAARRNQFHCGRQRELRATAGAGEAARQCPADFRQRLGETRQALQLAGIANLGPFGMVAVLQAAGRVAPDGLQMAARIGAVAGFDISRRHSEAIQPARQQLVADRFAVTFDVVEF